MFVLINGSMTGINFAGFLKVKGKISQINLLCKIFKKDKKKVGRKMQLSLYKKKHLSHCWGHKF